MVFINEWLPNPTGSDAKGEFIELFNAGTNAVNLDGWKLQVGNQKKVFHLDGYGIPAQHYLVLMRSVTTLAIKNSDESVTLFDSRGRVVDRSSFVGTAPEGKSYSRINYAIDPSNHFIFSDPTPGQANVIALNIAISHQSYTFHIPLNHPHPPWLELLFLAVGLGAFFSMLMLFLVKRDEKLAKLFLGRNEGVW
jgi:hypothetical protein